MIAHRMLIVLALPLLGCGGTPIEPAAGPAPAIGEQPPPAAGEPAAPEAPICADPGEQDFGSDLDAAHLVAATSTTVGCLREGDVDVFAVTAPISPGGSELRFRVKGAGLMAPIVEVLDGAGVLRSRVEAASRKPARGAFEVAAGGKVYLRVSQRGGVEETYTLVLERDAAPR